MEKLELIVPKMVTISRSATKKLNIGNYVKGHDYESYDTSCFKSIQIPAEEATPERSEEIAKELDVFCRDQVDLTALGKIQEIKKEAGLPAELYGKEYEEVANFLRAFYGAESKEDVEQTIEEVAKVKDSLSDNQIIVLRVAALKNKNRF